VLQVAPNYVKKLDNMLGGPHTPTAPLYYFIAEFYNVKRGGKLLFSAPGEFYYFLIRSVC